MIHFEYFQQKTLYVEENNIPKPNLECTCRFTWLVRMMSRTNSEVTKSHPKDDDIEFSMG